MKINDIIAEAGILGSIGRGIGRGLAGAATGAVRMLDKAGGGDGTNVGTAAQRAAYTNKMKQTQNAKARAKANLPAAAFAEFNNALKQNNINLQNPQSFDPASITNYLKSFAENYFAVGDEYHNNNQQKVIQVGVRNELNQIPLPTTINNISVQDYLEKANTSRNSIINQVDKMMATRQAAQPVTQEPAANQQTAPALPVSAGGVTLYRTASRDNAGQPTPTRVIYNTKQYALQDDGSWLDVLKNKTVNPALASFLQQELESIS